MTNTRATQTTILVIEDEAPVLQQIAGVLEGAGHACQCAHNAASACECIERATPDLIISDVNLAGQSGLALCEKLKQQFHLLDVPVMYLSAAQSPDIIRRSHGTYHVRKPFDPTVLLELVSQAQPARQLTSAN